MEQTKGQKLALEMLEQFEASATRVDIGAHHGVGESSVYFQLRFAKFLRHREANPDSRASIGAWHVFDKAWSATNKTATETARFAQLVAALPLASDAPAKAPKEPRKAKTANPANGEAHWPLATEAAAFIEAKATEPEPTPEPEPVAGGFTADALAALAEPLAAPAKDPIVAKREAKTLAGRLPRLRCDGRATASTAFLLSSRPADFVRKSPSARLMSQFEFLLPTLTFGRSAAEKLSEPNSFRFQPLESTVDFQERPRSPNGVKRSSQFW